MVSRLMQQQSSNTNDDRKRANILTPNRTSAGSSNPQFTLQITDDDGEKVLAQVQGRFWINNK